MSKTIPTFRRGNELLIGAAAIAAWKDQPAKCACGDHGDHESAIGGSCGDMPAQWLGCQNCGSSTGFPLVYRVQSQISAVLAEIAAPKVKADKAQKEQQARERHMASLERGWDGFQFIGVEAGRAKLAEMRP